MSVLSDLFSGRDAGAADSGMGYANLGRRGQDATNYDKLGDYGGQVFYGHDPARVKALQDEANYWDSLAKNGLTEGQQNTLLASYAGDPSADAARSTAALEQSERDRGLSPGGSIDTGARTSINNNFLEAYNGAKARLGQVKMNLPGQAMANRDAAYSQIVNPALSAATTGWGSASNIYGQQSQDYFGQAAAKRAAQQAAQSELLGTIGGIAGGGFFGGGGGMGAAATATGGGDGIVARQERLPGLGYGQHPI